MANELTVRKESIWSKIKNFFQDKIGKNHELENDNRNLNNYEKYINDIFQFFNDINKQAMKRYNLQPLEENVVKLLKEVGFSNEEIDHLMGKVRFDNFKFNNIWIKKEDSFGKRKEENELEHEEIDKKYQEAFRRDQENNKKAVNVNGKQIEAEEFVDEKGKGTIYRSPSDNKECVIRQGEDGKEIDINMSDVVKKMYGMEDLDLDVNINRVIDKNGNAKTEISGQTVDLDDNINGTYKQIIEEKDGKKISTTDIEEVKDKDGNTHQIVNEYLYTSNGVIQTKYVDGKAIFQMNRDAENGTIIKEMNENGDIGQVYIYGKDGNFEYSEKKNENGEKIASNEKYNGIDVIPTLKAEEKAVLNNERLNSSYMEKLNDAGTPESLKDTTHFWAYVPYNVAFGDILQAKEQLRNQERVVNQQQRNNKNLDDIERG